MDMVEVAAVEFGPFLRWLFALFPIKSGLQIGVVPEASFTRKMQTQQFRRGACRAEQTEPLHPSTLQAPPDTHEALVRDVDDSVLIERFAAEEA